MTAPSKPNLPASWVDRIWDRMQGRYGSLWLDRWRSGQTVDVAGQPMDAGILNAKRVWCDELGGFAERGDVISAALTACGSRPLPPTLPEFLQACRDAARTRGSATPRLEHTPSTEDWLRTRETARRVLGSVSRLAARKTVPGGES